MKKHIVPHHLLKLEIGEDNIYNGLNQSLNNQKGEIELRERVLSKVTIDNCFKAIYKNHSIPVMDNEVRKFIEQLPYEAQVLDIGGGWGWHWRNISVDRPDIKITIIDFVKGNLMIASEILHDNINKQIFLVHADATNLSFPDSCFDGAWTVQTLQHIYDFDIAINEIHRVIKVNGYFSNYSFNRQPHINLICKILGKKYINRGYFENGLWLERASKNQRRIIENIFCSNIEERFSEIIFSPELKLTFSSMEGSLLGKLDKVLSNNYGFLAWLARQRSFHCIKKA